ncbi:MAG: hypothetical protein AMXMBFR47_37460 [Planctomycetota bacterium]
MSRPVSMQLRIPAALVLALAAVLPAAAGDDPQQRAAQRERRRTPIVEVFEQCRDAVVNISTTRVERLPMRRFDMPLEDLFDFGRSPSRSVNSVGSGFVIHESGFIVTNAHVVGQATDVKVTFADNRTVPAVRVAVDAEHDLAILKVDSDRPLARLRLGHSDDLMIGETVVAIGNPLGLGHTVTTGIVSALNREISVGNTSVYDGLIQTDAAINPGNSGGPLLNINGDLIGVNTAIRGDAQNVGFAIPVDHLWELIPSMVDIENRARVRFGLVVSGTEAKVQAIRDGSPAEKAQIRRGDRVVKVDGHDIRDGIDYYVQLLFKKPGDKVGLTLARGDQSVSVAVPIESIPIPDGGSLAARLLGMKIAPIPDVARRRYEIPDGVGLWVEEVTGDPARRARFAEGDLILYINRTPVQSLQDVGLALEEVTPGESVMVEMARVRTERPFKQPVRLRTAGG